VVIASVAALAIVALFVFLWRKRQQQEPSEKKAKEPSKSESQVEVPGHGPTLPDPRCRTHAAPAPAVVQDDNDKAPLSEQRAERAPSMRISTSPVASARKNGGNALSLEGGSGGDVRAKELPKSDLPNSEAPEAEDAAPMAESMVEPAPSTRRSLSKAGSSLPTDHSKAALAPTPEGLASGRAAGEDAPTPSHRTLARTISSDLMRLSIGSAMEPLPEAGDEQQPIALPAAGVARPRIMVALHSWAGEEGAVDHYLTFSSGDRIEVVEDGEPGDWWMGKLVTDDADSVGWFPSSYTQLEEPAGSVGSETNQVESASEQLASAPEQLATPNVDSAEVQVDNVQELDSRVSGRAADARDLIAQDIQGSVPAPASEEMQAVAPLPTGPPTLPLEEKPSEGSTSTRKQTPPSSRRWLPSVSSRNKQNTDRTPSSRRPTPGASSRDESAEAASPGKQPNSEDSVRI